MFITRETDYAIRIVRNLSHDNVKSIAEIIDKEYIPNAMAYKVARLLNKAGILKSKSGVNGGYYLSKPLEETTLYDIYVAMNKNPSINECLNKPDSCPINNKRGCGVHRELARVQEILFEELQKTPISKMI